MNRRETSKVWSGLNGERKKIKQPKTRPARFAFRSGFPFGPTVFHVTHEAPSGRGLEHTFGIGPQHSKNDFLTYLIFRGAEGLELGLVVVEARVLGHEVVVRLVLVIFPKPIVSAEGQEVVVHRVTDSLKQKSTFGNRGIVAGRKCVKSFFRSRSRSPSIYLSLSSSL